MKEKKKKLKTTKPGVVSKVIKPHLDQPEKAEIHIPAAEELYQEIRIENKLEDEEGKQVKLKPGAPVEVTIETDKENTTEKSSDE